jgi:integrase
MAPRETPGTTLAAYTEEWLTRREDLKIGSADLYARVLRTHWLPILGSKTLRTIRREEVVSALAAMRRAGAKLKTRALRLDVLRSCLNSALEDGLLSANPAARAGRFLQPAPAERRREIELSVFTAEELRRIVDSARAQFPREVHILVLTLARTGLRPGEGRCLQISDVDLKARQIWVRRTEGRRARKHGVARFNAPKSHQIRRVDMSDQLVVEMREYVAGRAAQRSSGHWLFPSPPQTSVAGHERRPWPGADSVQVEAHQRRSGWHQLDEPIGHGTFSNVWRRLLERAGVKHRKPHALRHTYATRLIAEAVEHGQDGEAILHYVANNWAIRASKSRWTTMGTWYRPGGA